ncbi:hypothetical protein BGX23_008263 [Mortierella sp. AD031]|nr:hypothetical protein BGX23_008263 [Mortierella sp. AD031]
MVILRSVKDTGRQEHTNEGTTKELDSATIHSALFNFQSLLLVILLMICTCTYVQSQTSLLDRNKTGVLGIFWKAARIGERLSPYVSLACICMGISLLLPAK